MKKILFTATIIGLFCMPQIGVAMNKQVKAVSNVYIFNDTNNMINADLSYVYKGAVVHDKKNGRKIAAHQRGSLNVDEGKQVRVNIHGKTGQGIPYGAGIALKELSSGKARYLTFGMKDGKSVLYETTRK